MDLFNTTENTNVSEQEAPIFSLSASITGIELKCDISQLNFLSATAESNIANRVNIIYNIL